MYMARLFTKAQNQYQLVYKSSSVIKRGVKYENKDLVTVCVCSPNDNKAPVKSQPKIVLLCLFPSLNPTVRFAYFTIRRSLVDIPFKSEFQFQSVRFGFIYSCAIGIRHRNNEIAGKKGCGEL